jgi:hypothetical protein
VIQLRHGQPSLRHSGLAKDIEDLCEPWMKEVDGLLEDAALVEEVYQAQGSGVVIAARADACKHQRRWRCGC